MKLYESILLFNDEGDDSDDPDRIAERSRNFTVHSQRRLTVSIEFPRSTQSLSFLAVVKAICEKGE